MLQTLRMYYPHRLIMFPVQGKGQWNNALQCHFCPFWTVPLRSHIVDQLLQVLTELSAPVLMAQSLLLRISGRSCHATLTSSTGRSLMRRKSLTKWFHLDGLLLWRDRLTVMGRTNRQLHPVRIPLMTLLRIHRLNLG